MGVRIEIIRCSEGPGSLDSALAEVLSAEQLCAQPAADLLRAAAPAVARSKNFRLSL